MDSSAAADFTGWGSKQGSKVKTWKKRFFVLRGRELVYYSSSGTNDSGSDEKGRLTVIGVDFAPDLKNGLLIRGEKKHKTQVLKMKTSTADESKAWLLQLRQAVVDVDATGMHRSASFRSRSFSSNSSSTASTAANGSNASSFFGSLAPVPEALHSAANVTRGSQRSLSVPGAVDVSDASYRRNSSSSSSSNQSLSLSLSPPNDKRGWLLKEGRTVKSWKKRFFVLRGVVLTYYADAQRSPKLGSIVVRAVETNFTTPFTLDVHAADNNGRILRIAADSLEDIEAWDVALTQAIAHSGRRSSNNASTSTKVPLYLSDNRHMSSSLSSVIDDANEDVDVDDATQQQQQQAHRTASSASLDRPTCVGWLLKQGRTSKQWKRRFVTLTADALEYRHDPNDFPNEDERIVRVTFETMAQHSGYDGAWSDDHDRSSRNSNALPVAKIALDSGRTIAFVAESPSAFTPWHDALSAWTATTSVPPNNQPVEALEEDDDAVEPAGIPVALEPAQPEVKYGWLLKQGSLIKSWKRRYFVLEGDALSYYEHIDKAPRGRGIVARVVRVASLSDRELLDVHLTSGRVLKLAPETTRELESWYASLLNASRLLSTKDNTDGSVDSNAGVTAAPLVTTSLLTASLGQRGWLLKRGQNVKSWKLRFFVLVRSRVVYYRTEADADADAKEPLGSGVVFDAAVGDARPLSIDVRFQNGRLLQLAAPDETLFRVWLHALQTASNLTESFLSQHGNDEENGGTNNQRTSSSAAFDDEFDLDFAADDDGVDDVYNNPLDDVDAEDATSGSAEWSAAMANKPEFERVRSLSSASSSSSMSSCSTTDDAAITTSSDALADAAAAVPVLAGWLSKQSRGLKRWKRRFFSLHGVTLRSFKHESGPLDRSFTITHVDEQLDVPLGLTVATTKTRRTLVLTAESKDDYARWLSGLRAAIEAHAAATPAASPLLAVKALASVVTAPVAITAVTTAATTMEPAVDLGRVSTVTNADGKTVTSYSGWLDKEGQRFKTWKRRYFTYKRGALLYYSDIGAAALGHGVVMSVRVDHTRAFTLSIALEHDRVLRVAAADADDMDTWLRVLAADSPLLSPVAAPPMSPVAKSKSPIYSPTPVKKPQTPVVPQQHRDPHDYFTNDTISNESFLRLQDEQLRSHGDSNATALTSHRPFKGDLSFSVHHTGSGSGPPSTDRAAKLQLLTERTESEADLAYYRELLAESEREREKREAEKAQQDGTAITGCAPCCVVM